MNWITVKTTGNRWEAELMQQLLAAQDIQARIISQGLGSAYLGGGSPSALQVRLQDRWTALLLLSEIEESMTDDAFDDYSDDSPEGL